MRTRYSLFGNSYRMNGFLIAIFFLLFSYKDMLNIGNVLILSFVMVGSFIELWLHPDVEITQDGLKVYRIFGLIQDFVVWKDIVLYKKVGVLIIGGYQKYCKLAFMGRCFYKKTIFVASFMSNYDEVVKKIEDNLLSKDRVKIDLGY